MNKKIINVVTSAQPDIEQNSMVDEIIKQLRPEV
jgi:hypothetical protein